MYNDEQINSLKIIYNEKEIIYNSSDHGLCGGDGGYYFFQFLPER